MLLTPMISQHLLSARPSSNSPPHLTHPILKQHPTYISFYTLLSDQIRTWFLCVELLVFLVDALHCQVYSRTYRLVPIQGDGKKWTWNEINELSLQNALNAICTLTNWSMTQQIVIVMLLYCKPIFTDKFASKDRCL